MLLTVLITIVASTTTETSTATISSAIASQIVLLVEVGRLILPSAQIAFLVTRSHRVLVKSSLISSSINSRQLLLMTFKLVHLSGCSSTISNFRLVGIGRSGKFSLSAEVSRMPLA